MSCRLAILSLLAIPLGAQAPKVPDAAFFTQDPKVVMALCSEETLALMDRSDIHLWIEYGNIWLSRGDRRKAEEAFDRALHVNPNVITNDYQAHHLIALAWLRHGFKAEALASYKTMTEMDLIARYMNRKNLFTMAAVELVSAGHVAEAATYMEAGYQLDKRDDQNFLQFARAAWFANQRDLAITYLSRAAYAAPRNADVWAEISTLMADHMLAQCKPKVP